MKCIRRWRLASVVLILGACGSAELDQDGDGFTELTNDCDDTNPNVHPDAPEICWNNIDDNCNGLLDEEGATSGRVWYADVDGDGYGIADVTVEACVQPENYAAERWDCDEGNPAVYPGATEVCDGIDNDCDGFADEPSAVDAEVWYPDADGDGFGDGDQPLSACAPPPGYVLTPGDCLDADPQVHPDMDEDCRTAVDDDCDGTPNGDNESPYGCRDFFGDADGDGFAGTADCLCAADDFYTEPESSDCDDNDPSRYPGAPTTQVWGPEDCDDRSTIDLSTLRSDIAPMANGFGSIRSGDLNQDGHTDLLFLGSDTTVMEGPISPDSTARNTGGPDSFGIYAAGGFVPDLDGDGEDDILVVPSSGADMGVYVFSSRDVGTGSAETALFFEPYTNLSGAFSESLLPTADLDEDGYAEVFHAVNGGATSVTVLDADGSVPDDHWDTAVLNVEGFGDRAPKIALHDLSGDGLPEVIQATGTRDVNNRTGGAWPQQSRHGALSVYEVFEDRSFGLSSIVLGQTHFGKGMVVIDQDGDGYLDVFSVDWYSSLGSGTSTLVGFAGPLAVEGTYETVRTTMSPDWRVAVPYRYDVLNQPGDLDQDGHPDLMVHGAEDDAWFIGSIEPGHHAVEDIGHQVLSREFGRLIALGDVDGDGADDAVYRAYRGTYPMPLVLLSGDLP